MKPIRPRLRSIFRDVREETYLGFDSISFIMSLFGALFGAAIIAVGVFFITEIVSLGISYMLLWLDIEFLADKIAALPYFLALITLLIFCVLFGATEGVRGYKQYLELMPHKDNGENKGNAR